MSRHVEIEDRDLSPVMRRLDEIEVLAEGGPGCFGQRMIDEEEFFVKLTRLRSVLPPCLQQSLDLLKARDQRLEDARGRAAGIREAARREAQDAQDKARQESARLVKAAQERREQLLKQAESRAQRIAGEAQQQAKSLLADHPLITREEQAAAAQRDDVERQDREMKQAAQQDAHELEMEVTRYTIELLDKVGIALGKLQLKVQRDKLLVGATSGATAVVADE